MNLLHLKYVAHSEHVLGLKSKLQTLPDVDFVLMFNFSGIQDWSDIEFGISEGVDFIAMSFVNDAESVRHLKDYLTIKSLK